LKKGGKKKSDMNVEKRLFETKASGTTTCGGFSRAGNLPTPNSNNQQKSQCCWLAAASPFASTPHDHSTCGWDLVQTHKEEQDRIEKAK
jgi:hypothetical protein